MTGFWPILRKSRGRRLAKADPRRIVIRLGWHNAPRSRFAGLRVLSLAAMVAAAAAAPAQAADDTQLGGLLAAHPLTQMETGEKPLLAQDAELTVLAFWATWCKPCKEEMPKLAELNKFITARGGQVLAVSIDRDPANVRRFLEGLGVDLPVYVDGPEGLAKALDLESLPMTYVLDNQGAVVYRAKKSTEWTELVQAVEQRLPTGVRHAK